MNDDSVISIRPHPEDPDPSPIGPGMVPALKDRARLARPMFRRGWLRDGPQRHGNRRGDEPFIALGWDEAIERVADELKRVKNMHGNSAIFGGSYGWGSAGRFHHCQSQLHRFLNCIGGYTYSVNTYSSGAMEVILPHVLGRASSIRDLTAFPTWQEIAANTQLVVAFGGLARKNSQVNAGGVLRHFIGDEQLKCRRNGVRFVNVSPLRDDVHTSLQPTWLPIRPNTDTALMLGLAHTLVATDTYDKEFLRRCCVGVERFLAYLSGNSDGQPKSAAWASVITGVPERSILGLATDIATHRTLITTSFSIQRGEHGEQPYWAAIALAAMSGSMGLPGGGFGPGYGAFHRIGTLPSTVHVAALAQGKNPVSSFIPCARIADMLLSPGESFDYDGGTYCYPDIRLIYWCGGNVFHHHQDLNRLVRAWQEPETIIVHEPWYNAMARHADIVLPAALPLERDDIAAGTGEHVLIAMQKAIEPPGETRTDYEIFSALATRLGEGPSFTEGRSVMEWLRYLYDQTVAVACEVGVVMPTFDDFWETGRCEVPERPAPASPFVALRKAPDLAPLDTPSGRLEIFSETIASFGYADCPGHPAWIEPAEWLGSVRAKQFPLHLISSQPQRRLHSQYDNGAVSQAGKISGREPLLMNPADARSRGIDEGQVVRVHNDRGATLAGVELSDTIRQGVVRLATGAWYDPTTLDGRPLDAHGNPNVLTADRPASALSQATSALTALVEVSPIVGPLPPVKVFEGVPTVAPDQQPATMEEA